MKLSEIKQILSLEGIQLTKSLGQNFLHDRNQLDRIAQAARLEPGQNVLEIGPGLGPLTHALLAEHCRVLAIEKDERLANFLSRKFASNSSFTLIRGDALNYLRHHHQDWSGWKMVSNLPYSVASPILVEITRVPHPPEMIVATLQLEVAQRLMAGPDSKDYGLLSLLVQRQYSPGKVFKIPPGSFFPSPGVDSACITLEKRPHSLVEPHLNRPFERIVKCSFSQRRKMMMKLLKTEWPPTALEEAFRIIGLSPTIRAEKVSIDQFAELTRLLTSFHNKSDAGRNF
jgi:16S rRNA (adenine1518-N6/adenine1519-N6)-dimethyltransferase